jgi:hypothetical protein
MRTLPLVLLLAACASPAASSLPEGFEMPPPAPALDQHAWLHQLVGDWNVTYEVSMDPSAEPIKMEARASTRKVGELWILVEGSANFDGQAFSSFMTLGYSPAQEAFSGTWVDSMQTQLWVYRGTLDSTGKILTLVSEGPSMGDASVMTEFRDVIELKSKDQYLLNSSVKGPDGAWTTIMTATYRRR